MSIKLSAWMPVDGGHCCTRVIDGSDPELICNRVAFIEKTARVRIAPFTDQNEDWKNWQSGPKGRGGGDPEQDETYGFDPSSREWCDSMLLALGYELK
jgi:hypothetical protein